MKKARKSLKQSFFLGNYQDVVSEGLLEGSDRLSTEDFCFTVAALCFTGRKEEAEQLFLDRKKRLDETSQVMCRFFLGISFCRHGGYENARNYFASNLQAYRKDPKHLFYAKQGLGFYHYFCANFEKSRKTVESALAHATAENFVYGRALASDLLGHSLVQLGKVTSGLAKLEDAQKLAHRIGDGGLAHSLEISRLIYRAQYGFDSENSLNELNTAYRKLDPQNTHARANLLLETANQQLLRGKLKDASLTLEEASRWIYQSQHRRFNYVLTLRLAELSYHSGQYARALHSVQNVRTQLDPRHDCLTLLMALGLEVKLLRALKMSEPEWMGQQIRKITLKTGRAMSLAILLREDGKETPGEDFVAELFYSIRNEEPEDVSKKIIESGFYSFLQDAFKIDRRKKVLAMGIASKTCVIFDQGEVHLGEELSKQMQSLLGLLAQGEKTKSELVKTLWGYEYHPLKHDALIYQSVSRLRTLLKSYSEWIEISESGYRLRSDVQVIDFAKAISQVIKKPKANFKSVNPASTGTLDLSERQAYILEMFQRKAVLGVPDFQKKLKVSEMTLRRDFTGLVEAGLLRRIGRARSTRYRLQKPLALATRGP